MDIYILWYAWDEWKIHSIYRNREDAEEMVLKEKESTGAAQYMQYKIETRYLNLGK